MSDFAESDEETKTTPAEVYTTGPDVKTQPTPSTPAHEPAHTEQKPAASSGGDSEERAAVFSGLY
jgi:hypothetical protein